MVNKRQYIFMSFFLARALFFGGALSLLINISKNNILVTGFLGMLLGYVLLYLFYKKDRVNKYLTIIVSLLCVFIMTISSTVLTSNFLLNETPSFIVMILFFIPVLFGISKNTKVISRLGEIYFPISILISLFAYIALLYLVHIDNLLPMFNTNFIDFVKGIIIFTGASLLPNILLINYKNDLDFYSVSKGYVLGSLSIIIIMFFILSIYGYEFASIVRFPEYLILKKIDVFNYVSNVENIFVLEWICNLLLCSIFCTKVLFDKINKKYFIVSFILLIGLILFVLSHNYIIISFIKSYSYYVVFLVLILSLIIKKDKSIN